MSFDLILAVIFAAFIVYGLWVGLISTIGSLLGLVIGALAAGRYGPRLAEATRFLYGGNMGLAGLVSFFVIFVATEKLVGIAFWFVERAWKLARWIPFAKTANRIGGAVLGAVSGVFAIGLVLHVGAGMEITPAFDQALKDSLLAPLFMKAASVALPLLPEALRGVRDVI